MALAISCRFTGNTEQRRYPTPLDKSSHEDDSASTVSTMASPTGDFGGLSTDDASPARTEGKAVVNFPQKLRSNSPESCSTASPRDDFVRELEVDVETLSESKVTAAGAAALSAISPRVPASGSPARRSAPMLPLICLRPAGPEAKSSPTGETSEADMAQLDSTSTTASTPAAKTGTERSKPLLLLPSACLIRNTQEAAARPFLPMPRRSLFPTDEDVSPSTRGKHNDMRSVSMTAFDSNSSCTSSMTSKRSRPLLTRRVSFADDERLQEIIPIAALAGEPSPRMLEEQ
mmetsp:Transcript_11013/g.23938  ORF Transcript_11013/g.23938 Transcript_11013/m.23938 type:complete len:289 (-) Transcript_11013:43-909(-)